MERIKQYFQATCELLNQPWKDKNDFTSYGDIFLFGTENQEEIANVIKFKNQSVFTVCSSGEPYLNAVYNEADEIDVYDINCLQHPVIYLKIASILALDYEEFFSFLVPVCHKKASGDFLHPNLFYKVAPFLPDDFAWYWTEVINICLKQGFGSYLCLDSLIWSDIEIIKKGIPFYMNKESYYKLQALLRERAFPKFHELDIYRNTVDKGKKYDILYLSNIIQHNVAVISERYQQSFMPYNQNSIEKEVLKQMLPNINALLKEAGTALVGYCSNRSIDDAYDFLYTNPIFEVTCVPEKLPAYYNWESNTDLILTYTPSKKGKIDDYLK